MTISHFFHHIKRGFAFSVFLAYSSTLPFAFAQEEYVIEVSPLFEYPTAPESLESIQQKSDWLMAHFWDNFDFKSKSTVDQSALNHAFSTYVVPMRFASEKEALASTARLIEKLSKNPTLLIQFTKAAEEALYGPRASYWIDDVYIEYLRALTKNKKIPAARKIRYAEQLKILTSTHVGESAPQFSFTDLYGNEGVYRPMSTFTIIEFGDPDCDDCRHSRLKMEVNARLSALVDQGKVNILFIIPDADESWTVGVADYPGKWTVAASFDAADIYDLRLSPSFYIIGSNGKILKKNISVQEAIDTTLEYFN